MSTLKTLTIVAASVAGGTSLALSAGAALAQPATPVYPGYGYAPYGYGYVPSGPLYNYAAPAYGYAAPPYGPATGGQPPVAESVAGEAAGNPEAESIATQTARHRGSIYMSAGGGRTPKKGTLKPAPANGGY